MVLRLLRRLSYVWRHRQIDADLADELAFHREMKRQELEGEGMSSSLAEHATRRALGNGTLAREDARAVWVPTALEQLLQDLRFGFRILTKSRALSGTAVTLLALVIGGNTTIFSIVHTILTKPAPGVQSSGLVTARWVDAKGWIEPGTSYANYMDFADRATTLEPVIAFDYDRVTLMYENQSHAVWGSLVTSNHFVTLGVPLIKGRTFTPDEYEGTSGLVAVISQLAWEDYFQNAENVIGRPIVLNGYQATVVGVAAAPFRGVILGAPPADVWVPLVNYTRARGGGRSLQDRSGVGRLGVIGALAPGASLSQAQAELTGLWTQMKEAYPEIDQTFAVELMPYSAIAGGNSLVATRGNTFLALFSVVTLLTLMIVCANVANLLLARAVIRQREIALRQSLGASRGRIVRMLLAEGFAISVVSWAAALFFASAIAALAAGFIDPGPGRAVSRLDFTPDWTVAAYAMALAIVAMVAFTIAPAIRAWRLDLLPWLKAGEQGVVHGRSRLSSGLIVVQFALTVLLLTTAGLAVRSLFLVGHVDSGFDTRNLLLVTVNTSGSVRGSGANAVMLELLRERLRGVAGVERVTYARQVPREINWTTVGVRDPASSVVGVRAEVNHVGPGYLQVLGLSALSGREFDVQEPARGMPSALISRNLAEALWPGQSPLGRTMVMEQDSRLGTTAPPEVEVVGVAPDARYNNIRDDRRRFVFLSAQQMPASEGETTLHVKYSGSLDAVGPAIRQTLQQTDARIPVVYMRTWDRQVAEITGPIRILTTLVTLFAVGSLVIAAIGQYAAVSFDVRRRVREFGVRVALGATGRQVVTSVVREQSRLTVAGLMCGFVLSLVVANGLGRVLYGITPTDPLTYAAVFSLLAIVSLLACYVPARGAARTDPMAALRCE